MAWTVRGGDDVFARTLFKPAKFSDDRRNGGQNRRVVSPSLAEYGSGKNPG
jgi:hypothetical protein